MRNGAEAVQALALSSGHRWLLLVLNLRREVVLIDDYARGGGHRANAGLVPVKGIDV